ncbi:MAG: AIR synthase related protein [Thiotrichales bacterium]|nr:AIR synthase related protein [Thiotrichales bacterium]
MEEFEFIRRYFRDRATRRPGTVLGIGDDAALLDTGGLPLVRAWATAPLRADDEGAETARQVFRAAFIQLATRAVRPRWATLALTLEAAVPAQVESFAIAATALCDAYGVELVGGDTTRGPGRATVFASGTEDTRHRPPVDGNETAGPR